MKNRVTVRIGGGDYTIIAEETAEYITSVAQYYDKKLHELSSSGNLPALTSAILAGVNVTDEYFKMKQQADNLIVQLKEYLAEATKMRSELGEARRDADRARAEVSRLREKLSDS